MSCVRMEVSTRPAQTALHTEVVISCSCHCSGWCLPQTTVFTLAMVETISTDTRLLFVGNYFGHFRAIWLFLRLSRENEIADAQTDGGMLKILAISSQLCNLVKFVYYDWPLTNREQSSSSSSLCSTNAEIMIVLILDTTGNNSCRSLVSTAISSSCYGQPGSERWEGTSQPAHQQKQQLHSLLKSFDRCARAHTHTTVLRPQSRFTRVCRSKDSEETS